MSVKEDSELQHVLAHLWLALEAVAKGEDKAALYELDSIEGLIFFEDDDDRLDHLERVNYGDEKTEPLPEAEPLPEQKTEATEALPIG